jgi:hypothetical protein
VDPRHCRGGHGQSSAGLDPGEGERLAQRTGDSGRPHRDEADRGYDPDNEDWFFARYSARGSLTHAGKVAMCSDRHSSADGDDFASLND